MSGESITLYFRNASSDKVYHAELKPLNDGYVVEFAFGRRGATLQTGTKTQAPIEYPAAKKIYDKLVTEKTSKGYSTGNDGTPYVGTEQAGRVSGVQCQLLNAIDDRELANYINDPAWAFQEKIDGKRMLVRCLEDGLLEAINRKGLIVAMPLPIEQTLSAIKLPFIVDGEIVGDKFYLFDLLHYREQDLRALSYRARHELLLTLKTQLGFNGAVEIVEMVSTGAEKAAFAQQLRAAGKEGLVIKRLDAPYAAGRPASGGDQLKYKFTESLSAIVIKLNAKRSVQLGLIDNNGKIVDAGNVTILPNFTIPAIDSIVEVRYLYAHAQSGRLYQPLYLGERDDIDRTACLTSQLKLKTSVEEDE